MPAGGDQGCRGVPCCIPRCDRNKPPAHPVAKWMCPDHWGLIDLDLRRIYKAALTLWQSNPSRHHDRLMAAWLDCEAQAMERAP